MEYVGIYVGQVPMKLHSCPESRNLFFALEIFWKTTFQSMLNHVVTYFVETRGRHPKLVENLVTQFCSGQM